MPKSTAEATVDQNDTNGDARWSRIGINAVAAASICKSNGKAQSKDEKSSKVVFPFAETDFATD
jgi:hypothetical protein